MKLRQLIVSGCWVRTIRRLAKLAYAAERRNVAPGDLLERKVEFVEGGIAIEGIERGGGGLREDERLTHRLFAGGEIGEQGIAPAGAFGPVVVGEMCATGEVTRQRVGEHDKNFIEGPVEQVDEGVGMAQRRGDGLGAQQGFPVGPDLGPTGA